jgi:hypothetical protein
VRISTTEPGRDLSLLRTRKASPIIQVGAPEPVVVSKNAPTHSVEPELSVVKAKSSGLIDQVEPPNDNSTFTVVEHANDVLSDLPRDVREMCLR